MPVIVIVEKLVSVVKPPGRLGEIVKFTEERFCALTLQNNAGIFVPTLNTSEVGVDEFEHVTGKFAFVEDEDDPLPESNATRNVVELSLSEFELEQSEESIVKISI
ncbi:hypothetical protein LPTSP4_24950 [Leptospira ryugenii]|uniref:Uncharacterized protein n=1 Tax=Leptospira ryugenii TaxID=1917863 RepID=A0A2P2E2A0_9LEPT|nr:hypothetical protein [Leptospira ryugenii]GBF50964.1 hypothetical protein LPTSP4_24950 [Leptospira ryugenii]